MSLKILILRTHIDGFTIGLQQVLLMHPGTKAICRDNCLYKFPVRKRSYDLRLFNVPLPSISQGFNLMFVNLSSFSSLLQFLYSINLFYNCSMYFEKFSSTTFNTKKQILDLKDSFIYDLEKEVIDFWYSQEEVSLWQGS